jgi:hypothetical protein
VAATFDRKSVTGIINQEVVKPFFMDSNIHGNTIATLMSMDTAAAIEGRLWPSSVTAKAHRSLLEISLVVAHVKLLLWQDCGLDRKLQGNPGLALQIGTEILKSPLEVATRFFHTVRDFNGYVGVVEALQAARSETVEIGGVAEYPVPVGMSQFKSLPSRYRNNPFETFSDQVAQYKDDIFDLWHSEFRTKGFTPPGGNNRLATYLRSLRGVRDSPLDPFFKPNTTEQSARLSAESIREILTRNPKNSIDGEFLSSYRDQSDHTQKVKEDEAMATPTTQQDPNKDQKTTGLVAQTKSDVSAAAKRVAVNRVVRLVREPLVAFLAVRIADSGEEGEKTEEEIEKETQSLRLKISAFLKSDEGEAAVKYLIAKGWELVRTWVPEDLHWVGDVIAEELRIQAWTVGIDKVADLVTESIVPQLRNLGTVMGSMAFSPPAVSEKKPTLAEKVRVSTGERTVNPPQAVQEANEAAIEAPRVHRARGF